MNIFLQLKHWQLFLLLFVVPFGIMMVLMGAVIAQEDPTVLLSAYPWIMVYYMAAFFGWFWSVGTHLHAKLPYGLRMNLRMFKWFLAIPVAYILTLVFFLFAFMRQFVDFKTMTPEEMPDMSGLAYLFLIIPVHLFSIFCIFYCIYFVAKCLKCVELQKNVELGDFIGEFVLVWILPVGIWFVQPRINRIYEESEA